MQIPEDTILAFCRQQKATLDKLSEACLDLTFTESAILLLFLAGVNQQAAKNERLDKPMAVFRLGEEAGRKLS